MDTLNAILRSVRLESSLLSRARYRDPWAVFTRGAHHPIFHAIASGSCRLTPEGAKQPTELVAGDVALLTAGDPHTMASTEHLEPVPVADLFNRGTGDVQLIDHGGAGDECRIICGTFHLDHHAATWLLELLPPLIHMRLDEGSEQEWLTSTLGLLEKELDRSGPGTQTIVSRLTDLIVVQTLRHHALGDPEGVRGWLAAVNDERVGQALAMIHNEPGADWSVTKLASKVGMSRSRFFERFAGLVGEPPARYLARWRASTAADLIRRRDVSTAELANLVGYSSERAFTTVFRKYLGLSPSEYRRQLRAASA